MLAFLLHSPGRERQIKVFSTEEFILKCIEVISLPLFVFPASWLSQLSPVTLTSLCLLLSCTRVFCPVVHLSKSLSRYWNVLAKLLLCLSLLREFVSRKSAKDLCFRASIFKGVFFFVNLCKSSWSWDWLWFQSWCFFPPPSGIIFHFDNVATLLRNSLTLKYNC